MPFQAKFTEDELLTYFKQFGSDISAENVKSAAAHLGVKVQSVTKRMNKISRLQKVGRGKWCLTANEILKAYEAPAATKPAPETRSYVPSKNAEFVPFGNYSPLKKIIQSKMFYPAFITGLSGNGKTLSVEQACAMLNRELIRVNITIETDEDDLLGGFRLVNGDTVWHNGPVIEALERGAILLLDEIDLASNKILCLQSILEGSGVYLKKIGSFVRPQRGFNIIATANTKGKGSDDGRFIGTNVLNEAFLERFALTFEQEYPSETVEQKILTALDIQLNGKTNETFIGNLTKWADIIRKTFAEGGVDEVISTRRLTHIVRAFSIFKNETKAIQVCLNRFDEETKQSFLDLYDKIVMPEEVAEEKTTAKTDVVDIETFS